ncbi:histidine kinase domain-containing protein [Ditylenchus destructor]|nr:histidine kinase domain-containing protein [Ditylenchus destructor]
MKAAEHGFSPPTAAGCDHHLEALLAAGGAAPSSAPTSCSSCRLFSFSWQRLEETPRDHPLQALRPPKEFARTRRGRQSQDEDDDARTERLERAKEEAMRAAREAEKAGSDGRSVVDVTACATKSRSTTAARRRDRRHRTALARHPPAREAARGGALRRRGGQARPRGSRRERPPGQGRRRGSAPGAGAGPARDLAQDPLPHGEAGRLPGKLAVLIVLASALIKATYKGRLGGRGQGRQGHRDRRGGIAAPSGRRGPHGPLQAQVEPHFLYNTLASIDHLIETDPPRASQMQKNLIALLRASMPTMRETNATGGGRPGSRDGRHPAVSGIFRRSAWKSGSSAASTCRTACSRRSSRP